MMQAEALINLPFKQMPSDIETEQSPRANAGFLRNNAINCSLQKYNILNGHHQSQR